MDSPEVAIGDCSRKHHHAERGTQADREDTDKFHFQEESKEIASMDIDLD
jgi:hypothetical protein